MSDRKTSIVQARKECYITGETGGALHPHEPLCGRNRQASLEEGLWVWVKAELHDWLHFTHEGELFSRELKKQMQRCWYEMKLYIDEWSIEKVSARWWDLFMINYLDDEEVEEMIEKQMEFVECQDIENKDYRGECDKCIFYKDNNGACSGEKEPMNQPCIGFVEGTEGDLYA